MPGEPDARGFVFESPAGEARIEQASNRSKAASSPLCGVAVSNIRWRSVSSVKSLQQFKPLLAPLMSTDAGVSFVHDYEVRAGASEALAALVCLDVVEADHGEGVSLKEGLRGREPRPGNLPRSGLRSKFPASTRPAG